jgi:predicted nucleic acid-binding protein
LIYLLDTNVLADFLNQKLSLTTLTQIIQQGERVCICRPVHYETIRGLTKVPSPRKLQVFNSQLLPMLEWVELRNADWELATQYWVSHYWRWQTVERYGLIDRGNCCTSRCDRHSRR